MAVMYLNIDTQKGFQEGGNLAVEGGIQCGDRQAVYLKNNKDKYTIVVSTVDWHPSTHCSFKENGGIWPAHCKQFSEDAAIYQPLLDILETCPNFTILTKGCDEDHEEYSIFKNEKSCKKLIDLVNAFDIDEIHVGGLVFEFCVADTIKDGLHYLPNVRFKVFKDFCPTLDKKLAEEFTKFIE